MKRIVFFIAVCVLLCLTGCSSSQSLEGKQAGEESLATSDHGLPLVTLPADTESATGQNTSLPEETDLFQNTDSQTTAGQNSTIPDETIPFVYDAYVGEPVFEVRQQCSDVMLFHTYSCCIWKDSKGYCIACNDSSTDQLFAVVRFSDDLELLEADGLELIEMIDPNGWSVRTLKDFIAQYGPYHVDLGSGFWYPTYFSKSGTVYMLSVFYDAEHGVSTITKIQAFPLTDLND